MSELKTNLEAILQEKTEKIIPENIKKGIQIFDIVGTLDEGIDTSDATATSNDILYPKTAYVNGEKVTGNIQTEILSSNLSLDNKTLDYTATNNYVFDYELEHDISVSCTSNINMTSFNIKTTATNKDFTVSEVFSGYTNVLNINFTKNVSDAIIELVVLLKNSSNQCYLGLLQLNYNLNVINTYVNTNTVITYTDNSQFVYNYGKNLYCLVTGDNDARRKYIYIYTFTVDNLVISFNSTASHLLYNMQDYNNNSIYTQCTWSPNGEHLSVCLEFDYMRSYHYVFAIINFNTALTSSSAYVIANTENDGNASRYKRVFLTDDYIIDGNIIYKFNNTSLEQYKTVNLSNITNRNTYDYAYTLNGIYYLYFSLSNAEVYVYKYDDLFNFTYIKSIPYSFNSSKVSYNKTLDGGNFYNESNIVISSNNTIYNIYTTTDSVDFASLEKNNVKYYNTTDATVSQNNVLEDKIAYGQNGKIIGTMSNNGELNYTPSTQAQSIPAGYTSGGTIEAARQTNEDYDECLQYTFKVMTGNDFNFLNYIKSDGNQHIDLGVKYTPTTKLVLDIEPVAKNNWQMFMSNNNDNNSHLFALQDCTQNNGGGFDVFLNNEYIRLSYNINQRLTITFDKNKFYIGNTLYKTFGSNTWDIPGNITLFNNSIMSLYNCKVYNNDNLIMDLYPVTDTSNVPALLNIVNNNIISNSGSGTFIGGED